jgi:FkbM family methyltransferase
MAERQLQTQLQTFLRGVLRRAMPMLPHELLVKIRHAPVVGKRLQALVNRSMGSSGVQEVEISAGALKGKKMLLNLATHKNYWLGAYELEVEQTLRRIVQPNFVAYDIGTHFGYFTLFLGDLCGSGGTVFAFEADPDNFETLTANLNLNHVQNIKGFHHAIAAESGTLSFLKTPSSEMGRIIDDKSKDDLDAAKHWIESLPVDEAQDLFAREQSLCSMELETHGQSNAEWERARTLASTATEKAGAGKFAAALADLKQARSLIGRQLSGAESVVEVPAIALDEFVFAEAGRRPDFLKIDVEGAEDVVLEGAKRVLEDVRPTILCEVHSTEVGHRVWSTLNKAGYRVFDMSNGWKPITHSYMPVPLGGLHIVAGHESRLHEPPFSL